MAGDKPFVLSRRGFLSLGLLFVPGFQSGSEPIEFLSYERVEPLLTGNRFTLPADLAGSSESRRVAWPRWIQNHDREIRSRLLRGEEDTLVNFVLFGVSFTDRPRVDLTNGMTDRQSQLTEERVQDFIAGVSKPDTERLRLLRNLLDRQGQSTATVPERERLRQYISRQVSRYLEERQQYGRAAGRQADVAVSSSSPLSGLYRDRGLSLDTDFRPNYAIEQALMEAKRRGLLKAVRRAAVIGPGLDFTDKDSGFDYYPLQTLQPFALADSLVRLDMARFTDLRMSIFDISGQPLDHLSGAVARARMNEPYTLQLVLNRATAWNDGASSYWSRLGNSIGSTINPLPAPSQVRNVDRRAIRIRPEVVTVFEPRSLNVVAQHLQTRPLEGFDLIVATNVLIYYDRFEQALALLNIESMLNPGGVFLSNDLVESDVGVKLRAAGTLAVSYSSDQADDVGIYTMPSFAPQLPPA